MRIINILLASLCFAAFANVNASNVIVNVSATQYQHVTGFGAAGMGTLMCPIQDTTIIAKLYGTDSPVGLNILRIEVSPNLIGDVTTKNWDTPYDWHGYINTVKCAKNRGAIIFCTPWSPPAEYKTNNSNKGEDSLGVGGRLKVENYKDFFPWLNTFCSYMKSNDAAVDIVSIQNEPDWQVSYSGCLYTPTEMHQLVKDYASLFTGAKLMGGESLCYNPTYTDSLLNDTSTSKYISYIGGHFYGNGTKYAPKSSATAVAHGIEAWMTEHYVDPRNEKSLGDSRVYDSPLWSEQITFAKEVNEAMLDNLSAYVYWYMRCNNGFLGDGNTVASGSGNEDMQITKRGYIMSHFTKNIIGSSRLGTTISTDATMKTSAYIKGDSIIVMIINEDTTSNETNVTLNLPYSIKTCTRTTTTQTLTCDKQEIAIAQPTKNPTMTVVPNSINTYIFTVNGTMKETNNENDIEVVLPSGKTAGSATWTAIGDGSYTFTGKDETDYVEFSLGDVSSYYDLALKISKGGSPYPKMQLVYGTTTLDKTWGAANNKTYYWQYNAAASIDNNNLRLSNDNLSDVKLRVCGNGKASTMTFSSILLHGATMSCLSGTPIGNLTYNGTLTNLSNSTVTSSTSNTAIYGNQASGNGSTNYVDISDYDAVNVVIKSITSGTPQLRFYGYYGSSNTKFDKTLDAISTPQTVTFSLSNYKSEGNIKLNFIKTASVYTFDVGDIYLTKENDPIKYYISGQKIIASDAALTTPETDASCTAVNVSGVKSLADPSATSMLDLDPTAFTNKNCLFIAPSTATALTQNNVIVGDVCAKLSLIDGSDFNAPAAFTATNATYAISSASRPMTTTAGARYGTIILPFAVSGNTTYKFFTVSSASASQLVLTEATSTEANKPYIFRLNTDASLADITATSARIVVTPSDLAQAAVNGTALTGSYTAQTITSTEAYYLGSSDQFYKNAGSFTVNPFHAYFNGAITSGANSFSLGEANSEVTTINNAISNTPLITTIGEGTISLAANKTTTVKVYNNSGMLMKHVSLHAGEDTTIDVPSGMYIVNGIKVSVK